MQPDKIILPIIHKWAKILWRKGLDYDELVAIGYCAAKPLDSDKTIDVINVWVMWMITKFITGDRRKGFHKDNVKTLSKILTNKELLQYPPNDAIIDIKDAINDLADYEAQLIYMRYWRGMTLTEIAKHFNKSFNWSRDNCERVLGLLKERLLR